jgi:thioesterase domain-containing protein
MLDELQATLYSEIPITQNMQVEVLSMDEHGLTLRAPLVANINHKGTVFAGSLNAVATLAGWGLLWVLLHDEGLSAQIVIQDSQIRYLHAVQDDFQATCNLPELAQLQRFFRALREKGRGRLELTTRIIVEGEIVLLFTGRYVALHPLE